MKKFWIALLVLLILTLFVLAIPSIIFLWELAVFLVGHP